jgi:uncharacterized membrane protein YgaE (UPF0421/DUF939 family)
MNSDWAWVGRSGALLTIFGVYVIWLDYKGEIDKSLDTVLEGFEEYLKKITPEQEKESLINLFKNQNIKYTEEQLEKLLETPTDRNKTFKTISVKFKEVSELTHKRVQNVEFLVLVLGTLIWGYGDLINKLYA